MYFQPRADQKRNGRDGEREGRLGGSVGDNLGEVPGRRPRDSDAAHHDDAQRAWEGGGGVRRSHVSGKVHGERRFLEEPRTR